MQKETQMLLLMLLVPMNLISPANLEWMMTLLFSCFDHLVEHSVFSELLLVAVLELQK